LVSMICHLLTSGQVNTVSSRTLSSYSQVAIPGEPPWSYRKDLTFPTWKWSDSTRYSDTSFQTKLRTTNPFRMKKFSESRSLQHHGRRTILPMTTGPDFKTANSFLGQSLSRTNWAFPPRSRFISQPLKMN